MTSTKELDARFKRREQNVTLVTGVQGSTNDPILEFFNCPGANSEIKRLVGLHPI